MSAFLRRFFGIIAIQRINSDADAGGDEGFLTVQRDGGARRFDDLAGDDGGILRLVDFLQDHGEFVASKAGHGVFLAYALLQSCRHFTQQNVAGVVAQRVVDGLEPIEIQEHDRHQMVVPFRPGQGLVETIEEQVAIGQMGQRVIVGQDLQSAFRLAAFDGDAGQVGRDPGQFPIMGRLIGRMAIVRHDQRQQLLEEEWTDTAKQGCRRCRAIRFRYSVHAGLCSMSSITPLNSSDRPCCCGAPRFLTSAKIRFRAACP